MKSFLKVLGFFAICMVASVNLCSCSSSDDEEVIEQQKNFNVTGKWTTVVAQPLENLGFEENKVFATSFQIACLDLVQVGNSGTLTWFGFDAEMNPIKVAHKGTFAIKDNKITINAPDSHWLTGTHVIESIEEYNGTLLMQWIVNTSLGKGRIVFTPSVHNNL